MAENDDFKVYQGSYIPGDGAPLVVISACSDKRKLYSEYFIFVQDSEKSFYTQVVSCKEAEIPNLDLKIDMDFMMKMALDFAKEKLKDHLYQKYEKTKERAYLYNQYKLSETDSSALVRLYMRNQYSEKVEMIIKDGACPKLFEFLTNLISLPKIILGD